MKALPPLSLYIHFPWCVAKCPYCDFNSHSLKGDLPAEAYVAALLRDLQSAAGALAGRPLHSIFMGGGTPSLFPPGAIGRLLSQIATHFHLGPAAEITLEANPGAVEHGTFTGYRAAGINRLSLGVQSFADDKLRALGRIHDSGAAHSAFAEARAAGFTNINLDLMYALPEQSLQEAALDIGCAIELQPEHISYYHLTLEPNTVFYARRPSLPDADRAWEIQQQAFAALDDAGYSNYEVSAWAQPGHDCAHNLNYWRYGDYLGIGAGAHSKFTLDDHSIVRETRVAHPRDYLQRVWNDEATTRTAISEPDRMFEFMLNNLRLRAGFSRGDFEQTTGLSAGWLDRPLAEAKRKGLLIETARGILQPSKLGWDFLDDLQQLFLPAD